MVAESTSGEGRYCGNCGAALGQNDRFCPSCGRPVHETASVPTPEADVGVPPPRSAPPPMQAPAPSGQNYGAGGGFLRSFGLGAGGCIGIVVALLPLLAGCSVIAVLAGGGG
jgi:hypothetical protein